MSFQKRSIRPLGRPLAIFDVDETLIWEKSMFSFLRFFLSTELGAEAGSKRYDTFTGDLTALSKLSPRETVNRAFYEVFRGHDIDKLTALARVWFAQKPAEKWFIPEVLATLRVHQQNGHRIALLSGSAQFILAPIATFIAPDDVLAIDLEVSEDGVCSGNIKGLQTIGDGKREALQVILRDVDSDPVISSFGYGDHESDAPFLNDCDAGFLVWRDGTSTRPDWAQNFHPIFINAAQAATSHTPTESYANV